MKTKLFFKNSQLPTPMASSAANYGKPLAKNKTTLQANTDENYMDYRRK